MPAVGCGRGSDGSPLAAMRSPSGSAAAMRGAPGNGHHESEPAVKESQPIQEQRSARDDLLDLHFGEELAMAGLAAKSLAAAKFLHGQLGPLRHANHLGGDLGPVQGRAPSVSLRAVAEAHDVVEFQGVARRGIAIVDDQLLPLGYFVLTPAVDDDRVQRSTPILSKTPISAAHRNRGAGQATHRSDGLPPKRAVPEERHAGSPII